MWANRISQRSRCFCHYSDWIYQLAALVMKKLFPGKNPIFVVVSSFVALQEELQIWGLHLFIWLFTTLQTYNRDAYSWYSAVTQGKCSLPASALLNCFHRLEVQTFMWRDRNVGYSEPVRGLSTLIQSKSPV